MQLVSIFGFVLNCLQNKGPIDQLVDEPKYKALYGRRSIHASQPKYHPECSTHTDYHLHHQQRLIQWSENLQYNKIARLNVRYMLADTLMLDGPIANAIIQRANKQVFAIWCKFNK